MGNDWRRKSSRLPQGSLSFLICINNLLDDLVSNAVQFQMQKSSMKFFGHDVSLSYFFKNANSSAKYLENDLAKIRYWVFQRKMNFNSNPSRQTQKVIFRPKTKQQNHCPLIFQSNFRHTHTFQKHLMLLDLQPDFKQFLQNTLNKLRTITLFLQKLQNLSSRSSLLKILVHSYGLSLTTVIMTIRKIRNDSI